MDIKIVSFYIIDGFVEMTCSTQCELNLYPSRSTARQFTSSVQMTKSTFPALEMVIDPVPLIILLKSTKFP